MFRLSTLTDQKLISTIYRLEEGSFAVTYQLDGDEVVKIIPVNDDIAQWDRIAREIVNTRYAPHLAYCGDECGGVNHFLSSQDFLDLAIPAEIIVTKSDSQ